MTSPRNIGLLHCGKHSFRLRVDVAACCGEIAVPRQVGKRVRVHVCRPPCKACVAERVERNVINLGQLASLYMPFLQCRLLDVPALRRSGKYPCTGRRAMAHFEDGERSKVKCVRYWPQYRTFLQDRLLERRGCRTRANTTGAASINRGSANTPRHTKPPSPSKPPVSRYANGTPTFAWQSTHAGNMTA
jgi:hypothetical protein